VRVLDRPHDREPALPRGLRDLVTGDPVFADRAGCDLSCALRQCQRLHHLDVL
jgi:hypothetical protein